jgi:hypothetical protein
MDDAKRYKISTFPKDGNLWRIDWMNGIRLNPHATSEQLIKVFLTRLNTLNDFNSTNPLNNKNLSKEHYSADIGVGLLPLVWIGSVWRDGHLVEKYIEHPTRTFEVDTNQAQFIIFSSSTKKGEASCRIIPAFQYPLGSEAWNGISKSPLIALPYNNDPHGLLVPAIEVIRFYYIYSSYSARALFFGQYDKLLREPTTFDPLTKVVTIFLHWFCRESDAWILARYKASPLMQERAKKIHEWIQLESLNRFASTPHGTSFFPFDGKSKLTAVVRPIVGEDGVKRFLAVRLVTCTAAMPFSDVVLEIEAKPSNPDEAEECKPIWGRIWPYGYDDIPKIFDHSGEPDKRYFPINIGVLEDRFAALEGKKLKVTRKISDKPSGKAIVKLPNNPKTGVGTSGGTYGENNTAKTNVRVDVTAQGDNSLKTDLVTFLEALEYLRSKKSIIVTTIPVGAGSYLHRDETISYFQPGRSEDRWTSIGAIIDEKERKRILPRRLIVAKLELNGRAGYAMEMERKPGKNETISILILAKEDFTEISSEEFKCFIRQCVDRNRWPSKKDTHRYRRSSVAHKSDESMGWRMAEELWGIGLLWD